MRAGIPLTGSENKHRLAGAIVSDECHNLAAVDRQVHALQRMNAAEVLGDADEADQGADGRGLP